MNKWKLPSHLEPYRELINILTWKSVEDAINIDDYSYVEGQVDLLQRLYDAGKLK